MPSADRRKFLKTATATAAATLTFDLSAFAKNAPAAHDATKGTTDAILGQGDFQFQTVPSWGVLDPDKVPLTHLHEMVQTKNGDLYIIGDNTHNNILVYRPDGTLVRTFGSDYDGGHGLTLVEEDGQEYLWVANAKKGNGFVRKIDLEGNTIMQINKPEGDAYANNNGRRGRYIPTEVEVNPANGDIYVADGYGSWYLAHYDKEGTLKNLYGGPKSGFHTMHGVRLDTRDPDNPFLWVTNRSNQKLHRWTLEGEELEVLHFPGAWPCRVTMIDDKHIVVPIIWANAKGGRGRRNNTGFAMVLNENNEPVSLIGGQAPDDQSKLYRRKKDLNGPFINPHDTYIDAEGDLYIPQWDSHGSYPLKLKRVKA